jgi:hypothetical protein
VVKRLTGGVGGKRAPPSQPATRVRGFIMAVGDA